MKAEERAALYREVILSNQEEQGMADKISQSYDAGNLILEQDLDLKAFKINHNGFDAIVLKKMSVYFSILPISACFSGFLLVLMLTNEWEEEEVFVLAVMPGQEKIWQETLLDEIDLTLSARSSDNYANFSIKFHSKADLSTVLEFGNQVIRAFNQPLSPAERIVEHIRSGQPS